MANSATTTQYVIESHLFLGEASACLKAVVGECLARTLPEMRLGFLERIYWFLHAYHDDWYIGGCVVLAILTESHQPDEGAEVVLAVAVLDDRHTRARMTAVLPEPRDECVTRRFLLGLLVSAIRVHHALAQLRCTRIGVI